MNKQLHVSALALIMGFCGAANAALIDRGGGLIYDDDLDITWLQDANYAMTSGYDANGRMPWNDAMTWAANLTYYDSVRGVTWSDWRLPSMVDSGPPGCASSDDCGYNVPPASGELAHLFYSELGNLAYYSSTGFTGGPVQPGWGLTNTGPFTNLTASYYWYGNEDVSNTNQAWDFSFSLGLQDVNAKTNGNNMVVWAVRDGDVAAVPIPAAVWLFGSGLLGLMGFARVKRNQGGFIPKSS